MAGDRDGYAKRAEVGDYGSAGQQEFERESAGAVGYATLQGTARSQSR